MNLPAPRLSWLVVGGWLLLRYGQRSCKGFFLCNGEPAGFGLPNVLCIQIGVGSLKCCRIKAAPLDDGVSDLEHVHVHFVGAGADHVGFQIVFDRFGFGLRRFNEGLQLFQLSDLRGDFVC